MEPLLKSTLFSWAWYHLRWTSCITVHNNAIDPPPQIKMAKITITSSMIEYLATSYVDSDACYELKLITSGYRFLLWVYFQCSQRALASTKRSSFSNRRISCCKSSGHWATVVTGFESFFWLSIFICDHSCKKRHLAISNTHTLYPF